MIQAIQEATAGAASGDVPDDEAYFYALILLAEFRAKEALRVILTAISLPGELPFDLFGDAITETLPPILAALSGDTTEFLEALIENRLLNESVRAAAAGAFFFLVRDGRTTRDSAVERLQFHLREAVANGRARRC